MSGDRFWRPPLPPVPLGPLSDLGVTDVDWLDARLRAASSELERSAERARKLHSITVALLRSITPAQVGETAVREGGEVVDASGGAMLTIAGDGQIEVVAAQHCPSDLLDWLQGRSILNAGPLRTPLESGEPGWLGSLHLAANIPGAPDSWALLPLTVRERVAGMLILCFEGRSAIPEEYRVFLTLLAQQCGQALERARLYEAERNARVNAQFAEQRITFLASVSTKLAETLTETEGMKTATELAAANVGDFCAIHMLDEDGTARLTAAAWNDDGTIRPFHPAGGSLPIDPASDLCYGFVMRTGEPQVVARVDDEILRRLAGNEANLERLREIGLTAFVCVPIRVRDAVVGSLTIATRRPGGEFSKSDVAIAEDLASRIARAVETSRLYENTLEASRAKSNFLAVMSHELRTPLNAIMGYADLVSMDVPAALPPEAKSHVERIRAAAKHLLRLVDDVLSFARAESGHDRLQIEPVTLSEAVDAAIGLIRPTANAKGLTVRVRMDEDAIIETDAARLAQILNNLLTNAVKFTAEGELNVEARIDRDNAIVRVADTGIGISGEHHNRIFDPFWQVDQGHARRFGGTGIGLGVARNLARVLGGRIDIDSELGGGSTFTLRIPRHYRAQDETAGTG